MALTLGDNFSYQGAKPLDARLNYDTIAAMKAVADATMYDGCLAYCAGTDKTYQWKSGNTVDETTGKWREYKSGASESEIKEIIDNSLRTDVYPIINSNIETANIATREYAVGDRVIIKGKRYKVTSAINIGDEFIKESDLQFIAFSESKGINNSADLFNIYTINANTISHYEEGVGLRVGTSYQNNAAGYVVLNKLFDLTPYTNLIAKCIPGSSKTTWQDIAVCVTNQNDRSGWSGSSYQPSELKQRGFITDFVRVNGGGSYITDPFTMTLNIANINKSQYISFRHGENWTNVIFTDIILTDTSKVANIAETTIDEDLVSLFNLLTS